MSWCEGCATLEKQLADRDATIAQQKHVLAGHVAHIEFLTTDLRKANEALANARESCPWAWSSADDNHLESMGESMVIQLSAGQLRGLLAERDATIERLTKPKARDDVSYMELLAADYAKVRGERDAARAALTRLADAAELYRSDTETEAIAVGKPCFVTDALEQAIKAARK